MTTDPVCGMKIDETKAPAQTMYQGKTYYFCSTQCRDSFNATPTKYVGKSATAKV
jgi:YHS domain-containing protein